MRRAPAVLLLLCVGASCAGPGSFSSHARVEFPKPGALDAFSNAGEAWLRGRWDEAEMWYRQAVAIDPEFTRARRRLQDLQIATFRRSEAYAEARAELLQNPNSPRCHYLMARVREGAARRAHLERALELDPWYGWARLGMAGYFEATEGRGSGTELLKQARELLPREPDIEIEILRLLSTTQEDDAIDRVLVASLRAHQNSDPRFAEVAAYRLVGRGGAHTGWDLYIERYVQENIEKVLRSDGACRALAEYVRLYATQQFRARTEEAISKFRRAGPYAGELESALAWLAAETFLASGRPSEALVEMERACAGGGRTPTLARRLRAMRVQARRYREALELGWEFRAQFGGALGDLSLRERQLYETGTAAADRPGDADAIFAFAQAAAACGWLEESSELAAQARILGLDNADVRELAKRVSAMRNYLKRIPQLLREGIPPGISLLPALKPLSDAGKEILGFDPVEGSRVRHYFPMGTLLDADPGSPGLAQTLGRYGFEIRLGKRLIGPVEAFALRSIASRDVSGKVLGRPYHGREVFGEGSSLFTRLEQSGVRFAGSTFPGSVFLVLDPIEDLANEMEDWVAFAGALDPDERTQQLPEAHNSRELLAADEPWDCARRLVLKAAARDPSPLAPRLLEIVRVHEYAHLADAEEFLPLIANIHHLFSWLWSSGFSVAWLEARLELRAELAALCVSRDPELSLATVVQSAGRPEDQPPHSRGFAELTQRFVAEVGRRIDAGALPAIDRRHPVLPQVWKLTADEIRSVALALAREEGIAGDGY